MPKLPKKSASAHDTPKRRPSGPRPFGPKPGAGAPAGAGPAPRKKRPARTDEPIPAAPAAPEPVEELPGFDDLGLTDAVRAAVAARGFETPTPIQARAIPPLVAGRDLIGLAQTGTGKTGAFAIPIVQRVDPADSATQVLVLAPTRELAVQVAGAIHDLAKGTGLRVVPVYGGQPIDRQFRALRAGAHVVVGTPGRLLDHLRRGSLSFASVRLAVLDEADEMLALGFADDLEALLAELPAERQIAFFSATMPPRIRELAERSLRDPVSIEIASRRRTLDTTNQTYYEVPKGRKREALARVLDMETPGPTIVFCRTRAETDELCEDLRLRGYNAEALHGDMNQGERDRVMRRFREGQADLLIATDVAARGLDIDTVTHVVNYDIPWDVEQYIHRIGRTGRAGRSGDAITLVSGREIFQLRNLERLIGAPIRAARIPTAADIAARRREVFLQSIREAVAEGDFDAELAMVADLAEDLELVDVAAAALRLLWKSQTPPAVEADPGPDFGPTETGMARLFVGMGRRDGLRAGDLVGAITAEAGLDGRDIGVIDLQDKSAFVEVPAPAADRVIEALRNAKIRHRRVKVDYALPPGAFRR